MADQVFNVAKGRGVEFYNRVESNDPANSALVIVALKATGIEADDTLRGHDTLDAVLTAANDEATNAGYARKVLTDADLAALPAPDDTNDRFEVDLPDQTFSAVQTTGGAWAKILVCYDPDSTGGSDTSIIPISHHDYPATPDGSDLVVQIANFLRAS